MKPLNLQWLLHLYAMALYNTDSARRGRMRGCFCFESIYDYPTTRAGTDSDKFTLNERRLRKEITLEFMLSLYYELALLSVHFLRRALTNGNSRTLYNSSLRYAHRRFRQLCAGLLRCGRLRAGVRRLFTCVVFGNDHKSLGNSRRRTSTRHRSAPMPDKRHSYPHSLNKNAYFYCSLTK